MASSLTKNGLCRGSALLSKKRKYSAATFDDRFDFSPGDDEYEELAKRFQSTNTKFLNSCAMKTYSEWTKAHTKKSYG